MSSMSTLNSTGSGRKIAGIAKDQVTGKIWIKCTLFQCRCFGITMLGRPPKKKKKTNQGAALGTDCRKAKGRNGNDGNCDGGSPKKNKVVAQPRKGMVQR